MRKPTVSEVTGFARDSFEGRLVYYTSPLV